MAPPLTFKKRYTTHKESKKNDQNIGVCKSTETEAREQKRHSSLLNQTTVLFLFYFKLFSFYGSSFTVLSIKTQKIVLILEIKDWFLINNNFVVVPFQV